MTRTHHYIPKPLQDRFILRMQCCDEAGNQTEEVPPLKEDEHKVLEHLLDNAIRYLAEEGSIDVIMRLAPQKGMDENLGQAFNSSAFLEICVCDYGLGIPDEHLENIFEHFYRVDSDLTRGVYGLGLGLTPEIRRKRRKNRICNR